MSRSWADHPQAHQQEGPCCFAAVPAPPVVQSQSVLLRLLVVRPVAVCQCQAVHVQVRELPALYLWSLAPPRVVLLDVYLLQLETVVVGWAVALQWPLAVRRALVHLVAKRSYVRAPEVLVGPLR